jgi:eukaryotic-like serine/threonine-protein kinase
VLGSSRFEVLRPVGAGGMGVVYEARDRATGERVALKTLHEQDATALYRLKQEFRRVQHIAHPNVIQFRELFEESGKWFLVMELVEGCDASSYVRGSENVRASAPTAEALQPLSTTIQTATTNDGAAETSDEPAIAPRDTTRVRHVVTQIALALEHLHAAGRVHCDIKPTNVLVDRSGRVVVLDLGLARLSAASTSSIDGLAGTVAYISPEQVSGGLATAASDCYSFGVVLFELLTGRPPFTGSPMKVLNDKCYGNEITAASLPPTTPPDLRDLCVALLSRDPSLRPTAADVVRTLVTDGRSPELGGADLPDQRVTLFGRARELECLRAALTAAKRERETRIVWVRGASGVGKSSLVRNFLEDVEHSTNTLVLTARCYERETVPFKAIDGIVDVLTNHLRGRSDDEVAALLPADVGELCAVFPVLTRVRAIERFVTASANRQNAADRRDRAFAALRDLLARLGERHTVILWVDDLQWGDADSMQLMREVLRPPASPPVLVIVTSRDEPTVDALVARLEADPATFLRLDVGALSPQEAHELATRLLHDCGVEPPGLAEVIAAESNGHPLHILELVKHAVSSPGDAGTLRLDDAIAARVARLPARQQLLLRLVCIAPAPVATATLQRAAGLESGRVLADVTMLATASFLRATAGTGSGFEPFHDRVRENVRTRTGADELRALHERMAIALENSGELVPAEVAMIHFVGCAQLDRAADYAARAGREAEQRLAFHRAAELYAFALEHGHQEARTALATRHAYTLSAAGRSLDAARAFAGAAQSAPDIERLELERHSVEHLLLAGELDEGWRAAARLLARVGVRLPDSAHGRIAALLLERARVRLRGLKFSPRSESDIDRATLQRLAVLWSLSSALTFVDPVVGLTIQARFLREALAAGEPRWVALAMALEVGYAGIPGPKAARRVDELYTRAKQLAGSVDSAVVAGFIDSGRGVAAFVMGSLPDALSLFDRAERAIRSDPEMQWAVGIMQALRLWLLWQLGRYRELVALQREYTRAAQEHGNLDGYRRFLRWSGNHAWLVRDDPAGAKAALADTARSEPTPITSAPLPAYYELFSRGTIDLYERDGIAALERLQRAAPLLRQLARIQSIDIDVAFLRGRAAVVAARDHRNTIAIAGDCAKHLSRAGTRYARMLRSQLDAAIADVRGDHDAAITALRAVIRDADELGHQGHAHAARMRLATHVSDPAAQAAADSSEAALRAEGVVSPHRFVNLFSP